jgi:histidyl-tRNA synthetase
MSRPDKTPAERPRGFIDRKGAEIAAEARVVEAAGAVFERWGFERLETPAFEFTEALGKFLPDEDRPNAGVFSLQDDDERWLSLRYDLTAPLARFVAENFQDLPRPFRRWQTGPVWRNEKPGPGRFRQFTQCDADAVGAPGPAADAEMIAMGAEAMAAIGIPAGGFQMRASTRKLLNGVLDAIGLDSARGQLIVLRAIDKLDRLGPKGVTLLLGEGRKDESGDFTKGAGLDAKAIDRVMSFVTVETGTRQETLAALEAVVGDTEQGKAGIAELAAIDDVLTALKVGDDQARFDPSVVRGLEYYTGAVYEAELTLSAGDGEDAGRFGSVGGGGRYDDLLTRFRGEQVPATGFSIGVSRLVTALAAIEQGAEAGPAKPVVVMAMDKVATVNEFELAAELRAAGIPAEVYLGGSGVRAQFKYADKRGAPIAVMCGQDERERGIVTIKDLDLGAEVAKNIEDNEAWRQANPAQFEAPREELVAAVRSVLDREFEK